MIGKIFSVFSIISIATAITTGNTKELCQGILDGASKGVSLTISLMGIMVLWNGVMYTFKESGIIKKLSKLLRPILQRIFPRSFSENIANEEITMCISANLLGVSNAATPIAISAMKELDKVNGSPYASDDMITLAMTGCFCFNIIPTTLLAIRSSHMAKINYELIVPIWICSGTCMIFGVILSKIASVRKRNK